MGGVTIKFGSLMLDSSIAGKLKENAEGKKHNIETTS
ncbi:hypothetical protein ACFL96_17340 [Thermoproteota archaeon]